MDRWWWIEIVRYIQTPLIGVIAGFCQHFDPLHHVLMPRRAASSAAPAAAPAIPIRNLPIHAPLFEGDSESDDDGNHTGNEPLAAVLISPVKARAAKRGIANKSDLEVWDLPDSEIIGV
jgi:hypothetical protein